MTFNPDNPKEHYPTPDEVIKQFNGRLATKEEIRMFNLSGYKAEAPKEGGFEPFNYDGEVVINYARIVQSEKASEYYNTDVGANLFEMELMVAEGDNEGRKFWKRYNLDTAIVDSKGKLPVQKLADQLSVLGVEFTDLESLEAKLDELVSLVPVVKARRAKIDGKDLQIVNFKGLADGTGSSETEKEW